MICCLIVCIVWSELVSVFIPFLESRVILDNYGHDILVVRVHAHEIIVVKVLGHYITIVGTYEARCSYRGSPTLGITCVTSQQFS